jgi:type I restriction enzyme M protein
MLSIAEDYVRDLNSDARLEVFGQEINPESYAICKADMLIKGQNAQNIKFGNSFTIDGHEREAFDYMLSNPPFGVDWKKVEKQIKEEHETRGDAGRFGAGYPRISDGSFLFLQHMISKMKLGDGSNSGSRIAIVFNGSPLFSGGAGSGESNIRRWIIENDWLEAIVAMPDQLFYNTGISTYVWIVTNRKSEERRGRVQLINATSFGVKMRKSLGNKRNEIGDGQRGTPDHIAEIVRIYGEFAEGERCKIFDNSDFGYQRITVERPLRLNFHITPERIARVRESAAFQNLARSKKKGEAALAEMEAGARLQTELLAALESLAGQFIKNRERFRELLQGEFAERGLKVSNAVFNSVMTELSERDETADICTDAAGEPEADAELRDYENVPLKEDIHEYFDREVKPHVADAWIDESKTRMGYEIPFTRYFYTFTPLRPLTAIETEIKELENEIQGMLEGVMF